MSILTTNPRCRVAPLVRPDILRWLPPRWELFLGNYQIIRHFKKLLRKIRRMARSGQIIDLNKLCFLLTGESRSGKTALVKFLVRCIVCEQLDDRTLDPCDGSCPTCRQQPELSGLAGLFAALRSEGPGCQDQVPIHFAIIDCTMIHSPEQLRDHLIGMNTEYKGIRILYFDEIHS